MKLKYIKKKMVILIFLIFILQTIYPIAGSSYQISRGEKSIFTLQNRGNILYVGGSGPNNFSSIQKAINAAHDGDTIFVYSGIYYEKIVINKTITLLGENKDTTIIDGSSINNCIKITKDSVIIRDFTIRKGLMGINIIKTSGHEIKNNKIRSNWNGIGLYQVTNSVISENSITDSFFEGINPIESTENTISKNRINWNIYGILFTKSNNNFVYENEFKKNTRGIEMVDQSSNNEIYHNNFYESGEDHAYDDFSNIWDDSYPSGGNYWDDYTGEDNDDDGIGDTPYDISGEGNNKDNYPLMNPYVPQQPPETPIISGPKSGFPGVLYFYHISDTVDPEGDMIYVFWDWDDGNTSGWLGPYNSGEEISSYHTWNTTGIYEIRAKLKDEHGAESGWGKLLVTIPKNKARSMLLYRLLERFELIQKFLINKI